MESIFLKNIYVNDKDKLKKLVLKCFLGANIQIRAKRAKKP